MLERANTSKDLASRSGIDFDGNLYFSENVLRRLEFFSFEEFD
jgi:hypothetical protein